VTQPSAPIEPASSAAAVASNPIDQPAATDPAPQIVAALPEAAPPEAAPPATSEPATPPADPFSRPAPGAAVKRHGFLVQVGAFHDETKAQKLCENLTAKGYDFSVSATHGGASQGWFFCRSSGVADHAEAIAMAQRLHAQENATTFLMPAPASSKN
jgi:cell division septation protein DedD